MSDTGVVFIACGIEEGTDTPAVPRALVGPTATGKTEAGVELAHRLGAEIMVVDSMTVYRGMDVGTAKPTPEQRAGVTHHLLDVAEPLEPFSVARFQGLARRAASEIFARGRATLMIGGSGLYYRAVVDGLEIPATDPRLRGRLEVEAWALGTRALHARLADLDPRAAEKIDPSNSRRTVRALEVAALTGRPFSSFAADWDRYPEGRVRAAGVTIPAAALRRRIETRARRMLDGGLVEEVRGLLKRGLGSRVTASQAIGYLEVAEHLAGRLTIAEVVERMVKRTRDLARRQLAWFRRDPRIRWFEAGPEGATSVVNDIEEHLRG